MEEENAINVFKKIKNAVQINSECNINRNIFDSISLAKNVLGYKNNHVKNLNNILNLSYELRFEVLKSEIDSIILDLEKDMLQKSSSMVDLESIDLVDSESKIEIPERGLKRIFIVHGHDPEMKEAVARVVLSLKLEPIILNEKPDENLAVLQKFKKYSDVDFAIVLLSPDDFAYRSGEFPGSGRYRARQNVILELGFFLAKLEGRIFILYRENNNFEFPSDYLGVLYTLYDSYGRWKHKLADELKAIDSKIDKNLI
jgi:predicted nucleotide-binding protein